jgi:hypothetical protein
MYGVALIGLYSVVAAVLINYLVAFTPIGPLFIDDTAVEPLKAIGTILVHIPIALFYVYIVLE